MTNPHNVDICVTCVSDKPPQLPLREELPSLGIEVVFNARGVGAKASKHESKKLLKQYRETEQLKAKKKSRIFALLSKKGNKEKQKEERENELRIPKALSYHSYQKELEHANGSSETSSSVSSWETNDTLESSDAENKGNGNDGKELSPMRSGKPVSPTFDKSQSKPPRTVEIPKHSPEELAIKEAFKIFSDPAFDKKTGMIRESRDTATQQTSQGSSTRHKDASVTREPSSPTGRDSSSQQRPLMGLDPSTFTSRNNRNNVPANVRVVGSSVRHKESSVPGESRSHTGRESSGRQQPPSGYDASTMSSRSKNGNHFPANVLDPSLPTTGRDTIDPSTITSQTTGSAVPANVQVFADGSAKAKLPGLTSASLASPSSSSAKDAATGPSSSGPTSHTHGNSTLTTVNDDSQKRPKVQVHSTPAIKAELPKLRFSDSDSSDEEEGDSQVSSLKDSAHSSVATNEKADAEIVVKLMNSPNNTSHTSEFIDLTAFSDNESSNADAESPRGSLKFRFDSDSESMSKDLSTLSSKQEGPPRALGQGFQVYPSPAIQRQLPGLRLHIPEVDDGYGNIVLDLSSVCDDGGHFTLPDVKKKRFDPPATKPVPEEKPVIRSPHTQRQVQLEPPSNSRALEERQDYDIMESPTYPTRHTAHGRYDYQKDATDQTAFDRRARSLIDDSSSKSLSQQSKSGDDEDPQFGLGEDDRGGQVIHSPHKSYSQDSVGEESTEGPRIPVLLTPPRTRHHSDAPQKYDTAAMEPTRQAAPLSPSLKQAVSKDSQGHGSTQMHVSFSQDVEEHYYDKDEERESFESHERDAAPEEIDLTDKQDIISYEDCFKIEEKSQDNDDRYPDSDDDLSAHAYHTFNAFLHTPANEGRDAVERQEDRKEALSSLPQEREAEQREAISSVRHGIQAKETENLRKEDGARKQQTEAEASNVSERLVRGLQSRKTQSHGIHAEGRPKRDPEETGFQPVHERNSFSYPEVSLLDALSQGSPLPRDFSEMIERNPNLARNKLEDVNSYPLHAACTRGFPDRFRDGQPCLVVDLVEDVVERRNLIASLIDADPSRSRCLNRDGDLPVHLLARQLMEWEARWYQKVYEKAREDSENELESGVGITRLYQTMSQCIDLLLKPVSTDSLLCQRSGSTGKLLPLHIAAIFTVTYETLRMVLESYEEAATVKCNLENIRTFIPDKTTPLELHDRLSTDFPKWEIEGVGNEDEIDWTQSALDKSYGTKGSMRRSDLMFAFNPNLLSYRSDKARIRRLESRIRREIEETEGDDGYELCRPVHLLWIWMCTFEGTEGDNDNYTESISRIVQSIPARSIKALASLPMNDGQPVLDKATPMCAAAIRNRLDEVADNEIAIPMAALSSGFRSSQRSIILRQWEHGTASRFCLQGRGFVGPLCRSLFNIKESNFPTSFVFLPYKLVTDGEGRLGLESAEAANIAMQFADCLLHLTDSKILLHFLEKKSVRFLGEHLRNEDKGEFERAENEVKEYVNKLLDLYKKGPAYFYYLDEFNGVPIVLEDSSVYPLVINDSVDMIRKVLPLMLTGMTLMRGEKAIAVLAKIILDPTIQRVQRHWVDAAKDILGYMYSPQTEWTPGYLQDLLPLRERLADFVERGPSEESIAGGGGLSSEWVVELSLVKMVVEMHDSKHSYAGLKPRRSGPLKVLWTKEHVFLNPDNRDHMYFIDFKSTSDLKEISSGDKNDALDALRKREEHQMVFTERGRSSPDSSASGEHNGGYDLLFGDLSLLPPDRSESGSDEDSGENNSTQDASLQVWAHDDFETMSTLKRSQMSSSKPISLLDFDDDLDLDSVLQLRILLDEQEAKLEFLKEKITEIEVEESELLDREEKLGAMLDGINNAKNSLLGSPTNKGLSRARTLLHRICELEERVLCREVEVGQLKNEIACFELDASQESPDVFLFDDL